MAFKIGEVVLLTGAGFTYNFGGYLGTHMSSAIFSDPFVQGHSGIKEIFRQKNGNYEAAYSEIVRSNDYSNEEKSNLKNVIIEAYKRMHHRIESLKDEQLLGNFMRALVRIFTCSGDERRFIFTLNQDLFLEKERNWQAPKAPDFREDLRRGGIDAVDFKAVQRLEGEINGQEAIRKIEDHAGPPYIKLHGSYGWYSSDGTHKILIGDDKLQQILEEPLLNWYYSLYKEILENYKNRRILIIGYSFGDGDGHINDPLLKAIKQNGSKVYVINPKSQNDFEADMVKKGRGALLEGLAGYYPWSLEQMLYNDRSAEWLKLERDLLQ